MIESTVKNAFLTYAFQNPERFRSDLSFSLSHLKDYVYDEFLERSVARKALLIDNESSRAIAVFCFLSVFALSLFLGVVGGVLSHSLDLGLEIGTSMLGLLTALQYHIMR